MAGAVRSSSVDADVVAQIDLAMARLAVPVRGRKEVWRVGRVFTICISGKNTSQHKGIEWSDIWKIAISNW